MRAIAAVLGIVVLIGCGTGEGPVEQQSDLVRLLPPSSELHGWTVSQGPIVHSPETLFEYLNGGAERYLSHGFRQLLHVRYQHGDDPLACVTLDIYDMGSELGAFGIYSAARSAGMEIRPWGAEGYRSGTIAATWRGSVYVHGEADDDRTELIAMLERLMTGAGKRASGEAAPPAVLAALPTAGRVARSERYVPADLLGHSFMPGGVLATYEVNGEQAELYLSDLADETAADKALAALRNHMTKWGTVESEPPISNQGFRYAEPTLGFGTVVTAGRFIVGIHGNLPVEEQDRVLAEAVAGLQ
jgi:hypothetical protein